VVLGDVVADRSGNHFSRSIASLAARSARIAVASDPAGARIRRTESLSSSGDHARIDKGLLASLKANSMPRHSGTVSSMLSSWQHLKIDAF
jgi:hypothetical protein